MPPSIILIGPSKAGKTTLAKALGEALDWPVVGLDDLRWGYFGEIDYDPTYADAVRREGGIAALAEYWKPFDIHGVERIVSDYLTGHVIAFGAGHSYYDDPEQFARAQAALAPFPHVILLLPSPDIEVSLAVLRNRLLDEPGLSEKSVDGINAVNRTFLTHPSNARLATHTVYTLGKSVEETRSELVAHILSRSSL